MNSALLTIDDFSSKNTPAMVNYLKEKNIKVIFFATGEKVEQFYDEAVYALKNGMIVGNHSYSHPGFSSLTLEECIAEIEKCERVLDKLYKDSGVKRVYKPFRFPYGDKGGENKAALQNYLAAHHFDKVDDRHIPYPWWHEHGLDKDIDTLWTFDFEEYRLQYDPTFTQESVWAKMHDANPKSGAVLFGEQQRHIVLMHAHDETDAIVPCYYRMFLDHLQEHGVVFDKPAFIRM